MMTIPTSRMSVVSLVAALAVTLAFVAAAAHAQPVPPSYGFDFVTIGDTYGGAGNPAFFSQSGARPLGSVPYEYRIGRLEVTTGQWMEFINTFASLPEYEFFGDPGLNWGAGPDALYGGPGRRYRLNSSFPNAAMVPVQGMSWREAATYCNWLHNGKSSDPASLITGAYDTTTWGGSPGGAGFTDAATHLPDAQYWIPTRNEWLKAAHFDPNRHGDGLGGWWEFPHMSDVAPIYGLPGVGESSASPAAGINRWQIPLGSYPDVMSYYGLLDLSGGASEWQEDYLSPLNRSFRLLDGRSAAESTDPAVGFNRDSILHLFSEWPTVGGGGLRIASAVPAPSSVGALALLCVALFQRRR